MQVHQLWTGSRMTINRVLGQTIKTEYRVFLRQILSDWLSVRDQIPLRVALHFALRGLRPLEVVRFGFDGSKVPEGYLGELDVLRLQARTATGADRLLHDKLAFHTSLPAVRPLTCKLIGLMVDGTFVSLLGQAPSTSQSVYASAIKEMLSEVPIVVKPVHGGEKRGVLVIRREGNRFLLGNKGVTEQQLLQELSKHYWSIVTAYAQQGQYAEAISPGLSNPIRVLTVRLRSGSARMIAASHLFSTVRSSPIPSGEDGALRASIDVEDGVMGWASWYDERGRLHDRYGKRYQSDSHPETGAIIMGVGVPGWRELRSSLVSTHENIPFIEAMSWDIVVTDHGPRVLEAERALSPRVYQRHGPLLANDVFDGLARRHGVCR